VFLVLLFLLLLLWTCLFIGPLVLNRYHFFFCLNKVKRNILVLVQLVPLEGGSGGPPVQNAHPT